jgi:hypothetical protein
LKLICTRSTPASHYARAAAKKVAAALDAKGVITLIGAIAGVTTDPVTGTFAAGTGLNNAVYYGRLHLDHDD